MPGRMKSALFPFGEQTPSSAILSYYYAMMLRDCQQMHKRFGFLKWTLQNREREPTYEELYQQVEDQLEEKRQDEMRIQTFKNLGWNGSRETTKHQIEASSHRSTQQGATEMQQYPPPPS